MEQLIMEMKEEIKAAADHLKEECEQVSAYIFSHPEVAFEEKQSQEALCTFLEKHGFAVTKGTGGLETAFEAVYVNGEGPTAAFMAEYDALPQIGHACGHNIIGTSSAGAGIVLKDIMEKHDIKGTLKIIGTPAEERVGGKILMIREGVFKGIDAAFIMHPCDASMPDDISFATVNLKFDFHGKSSHAAAFPWEGRSAVNGVIALFNNVNLLRLHLKDHTRVHGIITDGGSAHNVIPEHAAAIFNVRALNVDYLYEVMDQIKKCGEGAAIATGTEVTITEMDEINKEIRNDKKLVNIIRNNFEVSGEEYIERDLTQGIGSTDTGNVTHEIPAIQAYIKLRDHVATHTEEFREAAGGEEGKRALLQAVKVLAMSGLDIFMENN